MYCTIHDHNTKASWDSAHEPIAAVPTGKEVAFDIKEASNKIISPQSSEQDILKLSEPNANPLSGPVFIEGAHPGDLLAVHLHSFEHHGWGWTGIIPEFGLLQDIFTEPHLQISTIRGKTIDFAEGIQLPLRPFAGTLGATPGKKEATDSLIPHHLGGNIDCRHLVAGSTLYVPVEVEGALFCIGDTHALQGDGEVCGTAIEAPMQAVVSFSLVSQNDSRGLSALCPAPPSSNQAQVLVVSAVSTDLEQAARDATKRTIGYLCSTYKISETLAYMLCSIWGDLRITEIVNKPNITVSMHFDLSLFP